MKNATLSGALLALFLVTPLAAQDVRVGFAVDLGIPVGGFSSTDYPATGPNNPASTNTFNGGLGAELLFCVPVQQNLAVRFSVGALTFSGTSSSPGYASMNLQDQMISLGAEAQFFLGGGSASRQSGWYLLAGPSIDFERFDASYGNPDYDQSQTINSTRVAALVGVGTMWRGRWGHHYLLEAAYHKTLTNCSVSAGDQPGSDFLKVSFGVIM